MKNRFYNIIKLFLIFGVLSGLVFSESVSVSAEEEKEVLDHIASSDVYFSGYMLAIGNEEGWEETQSCICDSMSYLVAYNDNAEAILTVSDPDWDCVDIYTEGIYNLDFSLTICEEDAPYCVLDPSIQNVIIPVCVSNPEDFELFPARTTQTSHVIYFLPDIPSEETEIYIFFSDWECTFEELENCDWTLCSTDTAYMKSGGFSISRSALEVSNYAYFYLQYGDMRSQIIEVYENGKYSSVIGIGGDRDGGDASICNTPIVTQPAPITPAEKTTNRHRYCVNWRNCFRYLVFPQKGKVMKKVQYRLYFGMLMTAVLASLFFCFLYRYNNKYTQNSTQAINGLLILSDEELEEHPCRFLWNDWMYYPGVLLTPDDFLQGYPDRYMAYVDISASNRLKISRNSSNGNYGCGTYVMHCKLPDSVSSYAMDMPEVFSSYNMYVNEKLVMSIGNPQPDQYQDATGNRMVVFSPDENGMATIIIAVSNYSHIYGGMTYPPAFGTMKGLNYIRGIRLALCLCMLLLLSISITVSLYLWKKIHNQNALYFFLLCILMTGWMSYPILHTMLILPVFPAYFLEILFCYLSLFMMVMMHNYICNVHQKASWISNSIALLFCLGVSVYSLCAGFLPDSAANFLSCLIIGYKFLLAGYMIVTSCITAKKHYQAKQLLYVSVFFACACVWDRIFPDYDPIFGGWFLEWVCLFLVFVVAGMLWKLLTQSYVQNLLMKQQHHIMEKQLIMQTNYNHQLNIQIEERRRTVHDFRHHMRVIQTMAEQCGNQEIPAYLNSLSEYMTVPKDFTVQIESGKPTVDALFYYYQSIAEIKKIDLQLQWILPNQFPMTDVEICTLIGNLLENAIEACERLEDESVKKITLKTSVTECMWCITVENTYDGILNIQRDFLPETRKTDTQYHGIGLSSVSHIVKAHHGSLDLLPKGNLFFVGITIPV
ncbi:sensor histidine kinase [Porcipelethomonas sp.]|uniref:sensor histidine kinase n=1 Tax=Porcipelethomonas sp. TaxID=2981675 RepID=UPI003EF6B06A